MFKKFIASSIIFPGTVSLLAGCATVDDQNASERPWNTPKSWENGLPSSMTQGR